MDAPVEAFQLSLLGEDDRLEIIRSQFKRWPEFGELLIQRRKTWLAQNSRKRREPA